MATGTTIIDGALKALQVLREGGSHSTDQGTYALSVLNRLIGRFNLQRGMSVFYEGQANHSWTSGSSKTIGASGDFNVTWPTRIVFASYVGADGFAEPIKHTEDRSIYERVYDKALAGSPPELLYYDKAYPLGTLYVWPVPQAAWTLRLSTWNQLASIATVGTTVNLPPGYEDMLTWNLAEALWPTYPTEQTRDFVRTEATLSRAAVRGFNAVPPPILRLEPGMTRSRTYNITQDR